MQVLDLDAVAQQVVGQVLGHPLRQGCHQHAFVFRRALADFPEQVVDLVLGGLNNDLRVDEPGGSDHLLDVAVRDTQLVFARRGGEVDRLADTLQEFVPLQRPVVHGRGQAETVVHERALAGHVPLVHGTDLRHRHMGLVNDEKEVVREIVKETVRGGALPAAVDVPRIVLNAVAEPHLLHHFQVIGGAHAQPLGL